MDIMDKVILGQRIKEYRLSKKLKQEQFAEMVGITNVHLSEVERGKKAPGMETFIKMVNILDVPADLFLRYEVNGAKPYILNDITEKMKDLSPAQLKMVEELFNTAVSNFAYLDRKAGAEETE